MEYKSLGSTGVMVSSLCFGTMSFGGDADEATSAAMYNLCREKGINFFDCANVYAGGVQKKSWANLCTITAMKWLSLLKSISQPDLMLTREDQPAEIS